MRGRREIIIDLSVNTAIQRPFMAVFTMIITPPQVTKLLLPITIH